MVDREMEQLNTTLLLIIKDNKILLAKKKRGFGEGKFNGVGGKVKEGETIEQAMIRETQEEIGIMPIGYEKIGNIVFDEFFKGKKIKINMTIYTAKDYIGTITESDEMQPYWFNLDNIPFNNMHPDDKYWLPELLKGKKFDAYFNIDEDEKITNYKIIEK